MGSILTFKLTLTLKVKVNHPTNNRDLSHVVLLLWSKFGDPGLNGSQVETRTSKGLMHEHMDVQTHGNNITRRPKLACVMDR